MTTHLNLVTFLTLRSSFLIDSQREPLPDEIPVPGIAADSRAGVLERFELEAGFRQSHGATVVDQALAVSGYEVGHFAALPHVTVEP